MKLRSNNEINTEFWQGNLLEIWTRQSVVTWPALNDPLLLLNPICRPNAKINLDCITILNLSFIIKEVHSQPFSFLRKTNRDSICNFKDLLSYENWEDVFLENNVNIIFNNFLNTYLRIFNTCFPIVKTHVSQKLKPWLTTGIRTSCANKRRLYESYRINNSAKFEEYYKNYCKIW